MRGIEPQLVERIHASGKQLVLAITGGGSGAIAALLEVPGGSCSVLEAVVPYAAAALEDWLGGTVDHYCTERTARAMAMAAFQRARELSVGDATVLRGIGATASLASNRPKHGAHRIHVAWQSADTTAVASCELVKGESTRAEEECIATQLILQAVAGACGVDINVTVSTLQCVPQRRIQKAPVAWTELLRGQRDSVDIAGNEASLPSRSILFPGAFNPLHDGHVRMAEVAAKRLGGPVTFEVSITNVDKPPLDFIEIADRVEQFKDRRVLLSRAPTFVEGELAPGCVFVAGIDTLERIGQTRYYGGDVSLRDVAIQEIARQGCRFLVFGRASKGGFLTLNDVELPKPLRALCDFVPEVDFRADVSSTQLRGG